MNRYINKLKSFLANQSANFPFDDANSVLEVLCYYYCSTNSVDNAVIRCQFKELNDILCRLSLTENDAVFAITGDLCTSHMRKAFLDGVRAGMCLYHELDDPS
jgi:hypothetical protein